MFHRQLRAHHWIQNRIPQVVSARFRPPAPTPLRVTARARPGSSEQVSNGRIWVDGDATEFGLASLVEVHYLVVRRLVVVWSIGLFLSRAFG